MICPNCDGDKCKVCHQTGEVSMSKALQISMKANDDAKKVLGDWRNWTQRKLSEYGGGAK
jgi:hypothetical protein